MDKKNNTMSFQFNHHDRENERKNNLYDELNDRKNDLGSEKNDLNKEQMDWKSNFDNERDDGLSAEPNRDSDVQQQDIDRNENIFPFPSKEREEQLNAFPVEPNPYPDQWGHDREEQGRQEDNYYEDNHRIPLSRYNHRKKKNRRDYSGSRQSQAHGTIWSSIRSSSKIIVTAGSAILIGILLGMIVLAIFSNLEENEPTVGSQAEQPGPESPGLPSSNEEDTNEAPDGGEDLTINLPGNEAEVGGEVLLPARGYFVVQAGVFSEEDAASELVSLMQSAGRAGIYLEAEQPFRTYIGIAGNREDAQSLASYFENQEIEYFVRQHESPVFSSQHPAANQVDTDELRSFLDYGDQLLEKLNHITAQGVANDSYQLSSENWSDIQEAHRLLLEASQSLSAQWSEGEAWLGNMTMQLTEAVNALETFQGQQHPSYLWKVQQLSLQYLKQYEQWLIPSS